MMNSTEQWSRLAATLTLVSASLLAGCAHVSHEQFEAEIAALRSEVEQGGQRDDEEVARRTAARMNQLGARLDAVARGLSDLEREFDNVSVQRTSSTVRFDVPVYFEFDRDVLRPEDLPVLDRFSEVVAEHYSDALFTVEGFTDRAGSVEYNLALGQRRAEAVRAYLINDGGFPAERVRAVSYGEAPNRMVSPGLAGRGVGIENRRVALVVEHIGLSDAVVVASDGGR